MTKTFSFRLEFGALEFICYFACLREAPPAKALCGGHALRHRQVLVIWYFYFVTKLLVPFFTQFYS